MSTTKKPTASVPAPDWFATAPRRGVGALGTAKRAGYTLTARERAGLLGGYRHPDGGVDRAHLAWMRDGLAVLWELAATRSFTARGVR